jgi:FkbM family methyltransferase
LFAGSDTVDRPRDDSRHSRASQRIRSPGFRLFGLRFSRDYLRFAWRAARHWGSTESGSLSLLGYRLDYFNQSHALFLVHEIFVNAAYDFTSPNLRPRIVDCGANIGMAVLFFKAVRPGAEVIAFEPHPVTFARLVETIDSNRLRDVHAENAAVGGTDGTVAFYSHQSDHGSLTGSIDRSWGGDERLETRTVRLSGWIREPVDFLKIDVEGAEYDVIDDLIETDAIRWVQEAAIEFHELDTRPARLTHMTKSLEAAGFHIQVTPAAAETRVGLIRARRK